MNGTSNAYIDYWNPDMGNRAWYRKLERDDATYLYRYEQDDPAESTLFGPAEAVGLPMNLANAGFLISDDSGNGLYDTALALTVDLVGVLVDTGQHVAAVSAVAAQREAAANDAVVSARERRKLVANESLPTERNQLTCHGLRSMLDATA